MATKTTAAANGNNYAECQARVAADKTGLSQVRCTPLRFRLSNPNMPMYQVVCRPLRDAVKVAR